MLTYPVKLHVAIGLDFHMCLHLHPCFMSACSDGSGESEHMCRFVRSFGVRRCDKYSCTNMIL